MLWSQLTKFRYSFETDDWLCYHWIYENRTNTLNQIIHGHFDFTTPKGLKITPTKRKILEREELEKGDKRVVKKRPTFLLIFISSTLEIAPSEEKKNAWAVRDFHNTVFINPDT